MSLEKGKDITSEMFEEESKKFIDDASLNLKAYCLPFIS